MLPRFRTEYSKRKVADRREIEAEVDGEMKLEVGVNQRQRVRREFGRKLLRHSCTAIDWVESNSFWLILILFIVFNAIYWSWLLIGAEHFQWSVNPLYNIVEGFKGTVPSKESLDPFGHGVLGQEGNNSQSAVQQEEGF